MVKPLKEKTNLTRISSVLSLFTLVAFHWPFFRLVLGNIEGGFNGVLITGGLGVLMFALNFLVYYLVLFLGRFVGKCNYKSVPTYPDVLAQSTRHCTDWSNGG